MPSAAIATAPRVRHPLLDASFLSVAFMTWISPLLSKRLDDEPLKEEDVWDLPKKAQQLETEFDSFRKKHPRLSLARLFWRLYKGPWLLSCAVYVLWCFTAGIGPVLVKRLVALLSLHADSEDHAQASWCSLTTC